MAAQSNTMIPSMGVMDTSMLTLSASNRNEGGLRGAGVSVDKRLPPPGLTSIDTQAESQKKYIGIYSPESRKKRVQRWECEEDVTGRFFEKRESRGCGRRR